MATGGRPGHPNKDIEAAIRYAEARGWTCEKRPDMLMPGVVFAVHSAGEMVANSRSGRLVSIRMDSPPTSTGAWIAVLMKRGRTMPKTVKKEPRRAARITYQFSLVYSGPSELTEELENVLFEAGCADALLGIHEGKVLLDFRRNAPSFQIALTSAIMDVERAGVGLELVRVEPA